MNMAIAMRNMCHTFVYGPGMPGTVESSRKPMMGSLPSILGKFNHDLAFLPSPGNHGKSWLVRGIMPKWP